MGINNSDDGYYITHGPNSILTAAQMGADVINMSWGGLGSCFASEQNLFNVLKSDY